MLQVRYFAVAKRFAKARWLSVSMLLAVLAAGTATARAEDFPTDPVGQTLFKQIWDRSDGPLVTRKTARSWVWGPGPFWAAQERYEESPGDKRYVLYFDKARMEFSHPEVNTVTNGLLVIEMISGVVQEGEARYVARPDGPAKINVVGDAGNWLTYQQLLPFTTVNNDNRAQSRLNQTIDDEITLEGLHRSARAGQQTIAYYDQTLGHNIPKVFWDFLNQSGPIYNLATGTYAAGQPINWLADAGYPVAEAYWVRQRVNGIEQDIMLQAFQRRTLTFTPDNPSAYQVEMGNVGRHYAFWRYFPKDFPTNLDWPAPDLRRMTALSAPCREGQLKGNKNSKIFHAPGQANYERTKTSVVCFDTEAAAGEAGYRKALR